MPNQMINGSIHSTKDIDYYKFTLVNDEKISFFGTFNLLDGNEKRALKAFDMTLISQNGTELAKSSISIEEGEYSVQKISIELKQGTYFVVVRNASTDKLDSELDNYSISTVLD